MDSFDIFISKAEAAQKAATAILDKIEAEGRTACTREERAEFDELMATCQRWQDKARAENRALGGPGAPPNPNYKPELGGHYLRGEQRFIDAVVPRGERRLSLGKTLKGMVIGSWEDADEERRAMAEGTLAGGGYVLPTSVSAQIVDFARDASVCLAAGALTKPLNPGTSRIPVITNDPAGVWHAENTDDASDQDLTLDARDLKPHTLTARMRASVELFEDSQALEAAMQDALRGALGLQLDQAALLSDGSGGVAPVGVLSYPNVQVESAYGAANYELFSHGVEAVASVNGKASAAIMSPNVFYFLDRLTDGVSRFQAPPDSYKALAKFQTNTLAPDSSGNGYVIIGDFSKMLFGIRSDFRIEINRYDTDSWQKLQVSVRIYGRFDVALLRPNQFVVFPGVTAA